MIDWLKKPNSIPKYKKGQRVQENKPAQGGVSSRDIRGKSKFSGERCIYDNVRKGTIISYAYPKPFNYRYKKWEQHKKSQWQYKLQWDGRPKPEGEGVIQGRLKPEEAK